MDKSVLPDTTVAVSDSINLSGTCESISVEEVSVLPETTIVSYPSSSTSMIDETLQEKLRTTWDHYKLTEMFSSSKRRERSFSHSIDGGKNTRSGVPKCSGGKVFKKPRLQRPSVQLDFSPGSDSSWVNCSSKGDRSVGPNSKAGEITSRGESDLSRPLKFPKPSFGLNCTVEMNESENEQSLTSDDDKVGGPYGRKSIFEKPKLRRISVQFDSSRTTSTKSSLGTEDFSVDDCKKKPKLSKPVLDNTVEFDECSISENLEDIASKVVNRALGRTFLKPCLVGDASVQVDDSFQNSNVKSPIVCEGPEAIGPYLESQSMADTNTATVRSFDPTKSELICGTEQVRELSMNGSAHPNETFGTTTPADNHLKFLKPSIVANASVEFNTSSCAVSVIKQDLEKSNAGPSEDFKGRRRSVRFNLPPLQDSDYRNFSGVTCTNVTTDKTLDFTLASDISFDGDESNVIVEESPARNKNIGEKTSPLYDDSLISDISKCSAVDSTSPKPDNDHPIEAIGKRRSVRFDLPPDGEIGSSSSSITCNTDVTSNKTVDFTIPTDVSFDDHESNVIVKKSSRGNRNNQGKRNSLKKALPQFEVSFLSNISKDSPSVEGNTDDPHDPLSSTKGDRNNFKGKRRSIRFDLPDEDTNQNVSAVTCNTDISTNKTCDFTVATNVSFDGDESDVLIKKIDQKINTSKKPSSQSDVSFFSDISKGSISEAGSKGESKVTEKRRSVRFDLPPHEGTSQNLSAVTCDTDVTLSKTVDFTVAADVGIGEVGSNILMQRSSTRKQEANATVMFDSSSEMQPDLSLIEGDASANGSREKRRPALSTLPPNSSGCGNNKDVTYSSKTLDFTAATEFSILADGCNVLIRKSAQEKKTVGDEEGCGSMTAPLGPDSPVLMSDNSPDRSDVTNFNNKTVDFTIFTSRKSSTKEQASETGKEDERHGWDFSPKATVPIHSSQYELRKSDISNISESNSKLNATETVRVGKNKFAFKKPFLQVHSVEFDESCLTDDSEIMRETPLARLTPEPDCHTFVPTENEASKLNELVLQVPRDPTRPDSLLSVHSESSLVFIDECSGHERTLDQPKVSTGQSEGESVPGSARNESIAQTSRETTLGLTSCIEDGISRVERLSEEDCSSETFDFDGDHESFSNCKSSDIFKPVDVDTCSPQNSLTDKNKVEAVIGIKLHADGQQNFPEPALQAIVEGQNTPEVYIQLCVSDLDVGVSGSDISNDTEDDRRGALRVSLGSSLKEKISSVPEMQIEHPSSPQILPQDLPFQYEERVLKTMKNESVGDKCLPEKVAPPDKATVRVEEVYMKPLPTNDQGGLSCQREAEEFHSAGITDTGHSQPLFQESPIHKEMKGSERICKSGYDGKVLLEVAQECQPQHDVPREKLLISVEEVSTGDNQMRLPCRTELQEPHPTGTKNMPEHLLKDVPFQKEKRCSRGGGRHENGGDGLLEVAEECLPKQDVSPEKGIISIPEINMDSASSSPLESANLECPPGEADLSLAGTSIIGRRPQPLPHESSPQQEKSNSTRRTSESGGDDLLKIAQECLSKQDLLPEKGIICIPEINIDSASSTSVVSANQECPPRVVDLSLAGISIIGRRPQSPTLELPPQPEKRNLTRRKRESGGDDLLKVAQECFPKQDITPEKVIISIPEIDIESAPSITSERANQECPPGEVDLSLAGTSIIGQRPQPLPQDSLPQPSKRNSTGRKSESGRDGLLNVAQERFPKQDISPERSIISIPEMDIESVPSNSSESVIQEYVPYQPQEEEPLPPKTTNTSHSQYLPQDLLSEGAKTCSKRRRKINDCEEVLVQKYAVTIRTVNEGEGISDRVPEVLLVNVNPQEEQKGGILVSKGGAEPTPKKIKRSIRFSKEITYLSPDQANEESGAVDTTIKRSLRSRKIHQEDSSIIVRGNGSSTRKRARRDLEDITNTEAKSTKLDSMYSLKQSKKKTSVSESPLLVPREASVGSGAGQHGTTIEQLSYDNLNISSITPVEGFQSRKKELVYHSTPLHRLMPPPKSNKPLRCSKTPSDPKFKTNKSIQVTREFSFSQSNSKSRSRSIDTKSVSKVTDTRSEGGSSFHSVEAGPSMKAKSEENSLNTERSFIQTRARTSSLSDGVSSASGSSSQQSSKASSFGCSEKPNASSVSTRSSKRSVESSAASRSFEVTAGLSGQVSVISFECSDVNDVGEVLPDSDIPEEPFESSSMITRDATLLTQNPATPTTTSPGFCRARGKKSAQGNPRKRRLDISRVLAEAEAREGGVLLPAPSMKVLVLPASGKWARRRLIPDVEKILRPRYSIEAKSKMEDFVVFLVVKVDSIIALKEADHYKIPFLEMRDAVRDLGICHTLWDFTRFIYDYLPFECKRKILPFGGGFYGTPKREPFIEGKLFDPL